MACFPQPRTCQAYIARAHPKRQNMSLRININVKQNKEDHAGENMCPLRQNGFVQTKSVATGLNIDTEILPAQFCSPEMLAWAEQQARM